MALAQPCIEKIYISLNAPLAFNLRQKILGDQNANLQYIINETNASVSLRGRSSGFAEPTTGLESNEPMHLYIEHPVMKSLIEAKNLARNLLETVQQDLQVFMQTNPTAQQNIPMQQPPPIIQATSNITIPSAILSVPPPNIIQNNTIQPTHIIQPPNFIPQSQIIPQQMQIIQQTPINIPPPAAINIPTIRTATSAPISVQFQGQPNIQIQPGTQPILVNQAPAQQYQLQYIQANPLTNAPQAQTIQHFIQPQQQIQGIIQPNTSQFITLQGNAAFMLPPPNIHNPQGLGAVFNTPPITINQVEDSKDPAKTEDSKTNPQSLATTSRALINQPPPNIQQFLVNTNAWPQNQQIQQVPIQILTQQQQPIRTANDILIQNAVPNAQGQQVLTTFTPQQGSSIQQIQFNNQPIITQPPPIPPQIQVQNAQNMEAQQSIIRPNQPSMSYQQQFEQKINMMSDIQRRPMKRKVDEPEEDANKSFPKTGMGSMTKSRPPPQIHPNQQMIKVGSNTRMITKPNVNTSSSSADNISIISSKNNSNKNIFTKTNSTASIATKTSVSQADQKASSTSNVKNEDFANQPTSSSITVAHQQIQSQFMQPPPNIQYNPTRAVPPQLMMYQTQLPPPSMQQPQQQDLSVFQNNNNFMPQLNVNRFNVPRGMILQMNTINDGTSAMGGNANFQQQPQPRFRPQW